MVWGLKQGMVGAAQQSLSPSLVALGPNRYLREKDFFKMLAIALGAHAVVLLIASLMPREEVTDIPVRALTFKIGGADRIAAYGAPTGVGTTVAAPAPAASSTPPGNWRATPLARPQPTPAKPAASYRPEPVKPARVIPIAPPRERTMPVENRAPQLAPIQPMPQPVAPEPVAPPTLAGLPDPTILTQVAAPAIAPTPQRFVREAGAAPAAGQTGAQPNTGSGVADGAVGGQGLETTMTQQTAQAIRERYEMQISGWIQTHKTYPAEAQGREGRVVVRMRIDRAGYVRYYALEQSSGVNALDAAAIDMVRRANPVPAVPANYPAGNLIEFLIPITFRAPR